MQLPKLIAVDLDGTLLPDSKQLSTYTQQVFAQLGALGMRTVVASGKFFHLTQDYARRLGLETGVVALDGARNRFEKGAPLAVSGMAREVVLALLDAHDGRHLGMFVDNGHDEVLLRFPGEAPPGIQLWATRIQRVEDAREHVKGDPALLVFYGHDAEELRVIAQAVENAYPQLRVGVFSTAMQGRTRILIQQRGLTKGSGLLECCAHFQLTPAECMVFGDWHNDLPMFELGCVGVAMANAIPELKTRADHITTWDCNADGVAHFLEQAFL